MKRIIICFLLIIEFSHAEKIKTPSLFETLKKEAYENNLESQYKLYELYSTGYEDIKKSSNNAYKWLLTSAEKGYVPSQLKLGIIFLEGGLRKHTDIAKSYYWFTQAAKNGNAHAQFRLGTFFEAGAFVSKDLEKAMYWFLKSAINKEPNAIEKLKQLQTNGYLYGYDDIIIQPIKDINFN